ncbi:hypothetical protein [uncultured Sphingomonas sp.]|uniref:hypothetical protein n=1 Tax=uncultured Sphingomonas sp. TaxID=158754 RepID=UPI0025CDBDDC|nr:hypothetical protein [uncultured Sphingomonas sp.]
MLRLIFPVACMLAMTSAVAAPPKRDASERATDNQDKVICKRFTETGSLVKSYRTCKTKREWEAERLNVQARNGTSSCPFQPNGGAC